MSNMDNHRDDILKAVVQTQRQDAIVLQKAIQQINVLTQALQQFGTQAQTSFAAVAKDINLLNGRIDELTALIDSTDPASPGETKEQESNGEKA